MLNFASIMGVNYSSYFQSVPVNPVSAAAQIAGLPVTSVKTFTHDYDLPFIKAAQAQKNLTLAVGCTNDELAGLANGNTQSLVSAIAPFADTVAWVCVGNEPLGSWYNHAYDALLVPAVTNVANAFKQAGLAIGVTVPQNFEFMQVSYPPSQGSVKPELANIIKGTCAVMRSTSAPFMVNIYPFITRVQNRSVVPLDYCLFTAPPDQWVKDGAYTYTNIFVAMIDALHVALDNIDCGDLEIVVGECGWPSSGDPDATNNNARTFNQGLINQCKSNQGTPRYPGKPIQCFVFEMYDEDRKPTGPGAFEPYWGVCDGAGNPKYKLMW
jgi:exo-beta-1,3-glucanase (GH17 family)